MLLLLVSLILTSPEKNLVEIWVIFRSEKVLSSSLILSVPFEKSGIIVATFISVLASETLQTSISAPPLPVAKIKKTAFKE